MTISHKNTTVYLLIKHTSDISFSSGPASSSKIRQCLISLNRFATTAPADPLPTIIKSYNRYSRDIYLKKITH